MRRTLLVARNTFRESVRDRLLATVLVFGGFLVASSTLLAQLTLGEEARVIRDLGLAAINLFSILTIILVGTQLVYREIEHRTIYTILTLPIRRAEFILGKYVGLCGAILFSVAVLAVVYLVVVGAHAGGVNGSLLAALSLTFLEAMVVTAIALFFSSVASPLLSAVFTFFVYAVGHMASDLKLLAGQSDSVVIQKVANVMYIILPSLHCFDIRNNILSATPVSWRQLAFCLAYAVLFSSAVLLVTVAVFRRRDFE